MKKPKFLKQYKTKDGLLSKIEEMDNPVFREMRAEFNCISPLTCTEGIELTENSHLGNNARSYTAKKQIPCLLFIYEED